MPLLGTKTPSAPVGDKSGGDTRAARSLLSCALWRGMGRLWRGMGGMGRPEPLSAHRPHQQQGLSGFNETRITRHETRLFPESRPFCRVGRSAGFKEGCTKRCVNEWKGVYPNPERKITTFSESGFGSGFGIPHYSSEFVGKIRISPCRPSSASAHAARSLLSCALWRGMGRLWRGMGGILSPNRRPRAVRCEIPAMCTKSRFPRKMREVLRSPLLPSPSGLNLLRWTRMDTPLPPPRQKRLSFVLIRVHSW